MKKCLLVEPINKSPYPPVGLMRISSFLKTDKNNKVFEHYGMDDPGLAIGKPDEIYVTTLFTWEATKVIKKINRLQYLFPDSKIHIGGIAASIMPDLFEKETGIKPTVGLHPEAELCPPDYTMTFGRNLDTSISSTTRGCNNGCDFCCVTLLEGRLHRRPNWQEDINPEFKRITLWDNNILGLNKRELLSTISKLKKFDKIVDFNQGLDARFYTPEKAEILHQITIDPIRFAYDSQGQEDHIIRAIRLAKKLTNREIRVYALYNFKDSPNDYFHRINILNKEGALVYPMKFRSMNSDTISKPNGKWDAKLLRAFGLSLRFYYRRGIITKNRKAFQDIYGENPAQFEQKLYDIYAYDKSLNKK